VTCALIACCSLAACSAGNAGTQRKPAAANGTTVAGTGASGGTGTHALGSGGNSAPPPSTHAGAGGAGTGDATVGNGGRPSAEDAGMQAAVDGGAAASGEPVCASAKEDAAAMLSCPAGQIIDRVVFASFGDPSGSCGRFSAGQCAATSALSVVEDLCVGRAGCTVLASNGTFGDPCRGMAKSLAIEARCAPGTPTVTQLPFKGVANSPCSVRRALGVSWYYNWGQTETEPCSNGDGGAFVPMIWGHTGDEQSAASITRSVASFATKGYGYVLGFNEPDNSSQSNISVATAVSLWPAFDNPALEIVSPGTAANANPGQAWFSEFMAQLNGKPELRADVMAIHWYGWNAGSCDASAAGLENYIKWAEDFPGNRPIWITEWGCLNQSAPDEDTVLAFFEGALAVFARHPRIERYAWYPWASNCHLANDDDSLTALGRAYAKAPAFK
jgi:hypothetical protein